MASERDEVIVGIDGSAGAEHALRWALHKTESLGRVTPVTAFQLPVTFDVLTDLGPGADVSSYRAGAEGRMMETIDNTDPGLRDRARVIEAHPGVGLVEIAAGADVLIHEAYGADGLRRRERETQGYHGTFHTSAIKVGEIAAEAGVGMVVLHHQLHLAGDTEEEMVEQVRLSFGGEVVYGRDLHVF